MIAIDVVGGVYGERCAFPDWNQIFGSAGRAAAALSAVASQVRLHTLLPTSFAPKASASLMQFGIDVQHHTGEQFIGFDYLHCLSDPMISPGVASIRKQQSFAVEAEFVIQFGMMECQPQTKSQMCVYDPQSPTQPLGFKATNNHAQRLAIVANAGEIQNLTGLDLNQAGPELLKREGAEVVVIKNGLHGAWVFKKGQEAQIIPAYKTNRVFTIGSGDVFVAAFAYGWMAKNMEPVAAADYASKAAAEYIETSTLPMMDDVAAFTKVRSPVTLKGGAIYLAGPFREIGQRHIIDDSRARLRTLGMQVFSPVHDIGHGPAAKVVQQDLAALERSDAVFAILNGSTPGTLFEVGYARSRGIPVYCVAQNMRDVDLKLPAGSGCLIFTDYVTALHEIAWRP